MCLCFYWWRLSRWHTVYNHAINAFFGVVIHRLSCGEILKNFFRSFKIFSALMQIGLRFNYGNIDVSFCLNLYWNELKVGKGIRYRCLGNSFLWALNGPKSWGMCKIIFKIGRLKIYVDYLLGLFVFPFHPSISSSSIEVQIPPASFLTRAHDILKEGTHYCNLDVVGSSHICYQSKTKKLFN